MIDACLQPVEAFSVRFGPNWQAYGTHQRFPVKAMDKGAPSGQKWIQLDLFTGEPIPPSDEKSEKQQRITKTPRLALAVQLSIARLDRLTDTMKFVSELCDRITGIVYPIDLDELP